MSDDLKRLLVENLFVSGRKTKEYEKTVRNQAEIENPLLVLENRIDLLVSSAGISFKSFREAEAPSESPSESELRVVV